MRFAQIILVLCTLFNNFLFAQQTIPSNHIYDTLFSKTLNEERRFIIHIPEGAQFNNNHYPVLYVFDAETQFTKTMGIIDHLSNTVGNEKCPPMIVVGIFHHNRLKDFIPPVSDSKFSVPDLFPQFLEKELIPYIDQKYPTHPFRVLVGHSLGGLRVINTLIYQPHLFNSYIALDPSLGHELPWIKKGIEYFDQTNLSNKSLYIAMGHTMPIGMDTSVIALDTSGNSRHMRCIMSFSNHANKAGKKDFDFNWKYYPTESHGAVAFNGLYDGLIFNFKWFVNEKLYDIFKPEVSVDASVKIITDYYSRISVKFGYKNIPKEEETSSLIDYLNYKKWYEKAFGFAQLNVQLYPQSRRAKQQFESAKWNLKKNISALLATKSIKSIYILCKKEALKNNPDYNISEEALNTIGYDLMNQHQLDKAEVIFKLNTELYPSSANTFDSLGECLLKMNKVKKGLEAYKKSVELDPENNNAIRILSTYSNYK